MKTFALLLSLFTTTALAQFGIPPGQASAPSAITPTSAPNVVQATTAAMTLYVDPTGSDGNVCTASGASACLTIQGALNKTPKLLRHGVTVNIAAGTYGCFYVSGFMSDTGLQQTTGGLLIDGALANITPATGTATGTATGGTAGSGSTYGTLVDSGQTWTVNNLRGHLVSVTGGTGSGQVRAISSNTSTTITIEGNWTSPTAGSTYVIQDPSVILNTACPAPATPALASSANSAVIQAFDNNINYRQQSIVFRNLKFTTTTANAYYIADSSSYEVIQNVITTAGGIALGGSAVVTSPGAPSFILSDSTLSTSGATFVTATSSASLQLQRSLAFGGSNFFSTSVGGNGWVSAILNRIECSNVSTICVAAGVGSYSIVNSRFDCGGNASDYAVSVGTTSRNNSITTGNPGASQGAFVSVATSDIGTAACGIGIVAAGNGVVWMNGNTGSAMTNAYAAQWGGKIYQNGASTATGGTTDVTLNAGAITAAIGDITAGTCLSDTTYGSKFCN